jgi:hypothetical protein
MVLRTKVQSTSQNVLENRMRAPSGDHTGQPSDMKSEAVS